MLFFFFMNPQFFFVFFYVPSFLVRWRILIIPLKKDGKQQVFFFFSHNIQRKTNRSPYDTCVARHTECFPSRLPLRLPILPQPDCIFLWSPKLRLSPHIGGYCLILSPCLVKMSHCCKNKGGFYFCLKYSQQLRPQSSMWKCNNKIRWCFRSQCLNKLKAVMYTKCGSWHLLLFIFNITAYLNEDLTNLAIILSIAVLYLLFYCSYSPFCFFRFPCRYPSSPFFWTWDTIVGISESNFIIL